MDGVAVRAKSDWPEQGRWTYEDWLALPSDGSRYEVIDGELFVTPAPSIAHQTVALNLAMPLRQYAAGHGGRVFAGPVDVRLPTQPVPLQPDLVYVSKDRSGIIGTQEVAGVPDLVVEILSPSNWPYDRTQKLAVYRAAGIPEYWIVDYREKSVEVLVFEDGEYVLASQWGPGSTLTSRVLPGFEVAVDEVFRDV
jgi:Uma2 family endonuclease